MIIKKENMMNPPNRIILERRMRIFPDIMATGIWCSRGSNHELSSVPLSDRTKIALIKMQNYYNIFFDHPKGTKDIDKLVSRAKKLAREDLPDWIIE